ncbi:MAG: O-antigen ligase family protein [Candidatus Woesearchaeota archaeon]
MFISIADITPFSYKALLILIILSLFILLSIFFLLIFKEPSLSLAFIIYSLWIVIYEPAICDIFASIAMLAFILNIFAQKTQLYKITFPDFMFIMFLIININNIFFTNVTAYSFKHFLITLYLIGFYFLVSYLADSYEKIHKIFNFYYIPVLITSVTMIFGFVIIYYFPSNFDFLRNLIVLGNRPKGFFKDPNVAGPFIIPVIVYSILKILNIKQKHLLILIFFLSISIVGVFLSFSRGAIITMTISIILSIIFSINRRNIIKISIFTIFILSFILIFIHYTPYSAQSSRIYNKDYGVESRIKKLNIGLQFIKENPLLGVGMIGIEKNEEPHDSYFLILKRTGIIGAICFWSAIFYLLIKLMISSFKISNINNKIIPLTLTISLFSIMISGVAVSFLHWRHFWLISGLAMATVRISEIDK